MKPAFAANHYLSSFTRRGTPLAMLLVLLAVSACGESGKKQLEMAAVQVYAKVSSLNVPSKEESGYHRLPIEVRQLAEGIYQATGQANSHLIVTAEGNVVFDTGLRTESVKQRKLLRRINDKPVSYILLSQAHRDHVGGERYWREKETKVIASQYFSETQHYYKALEPYFWQREKALSPWLAEQAPKAKMLAYGGIKPDIVVSEGEYVFELSGERFEVLATPGSEGEDSISLWLPERKILFSGDLFGEEWPQFPALFSMRGGKTPNAMAYVRSLDRIVALEPEMIIPSHHDPIEGKALIKQGLVKMRDAVHFVHDEVLRGMNEGKTVYQLMDSIQLPNELALSEERGRLAWAIKSIWEYYAGWFHFDKAAQLYAVPASAVYSDVVGISGVAPLLSKADAYLNQGKPVQALHLLDIALAGNANNPELLSAKLSVLKLISEKNGDIYGNKNEHRFLADKIKWIEVQLENIE